MKHFEKLPLRAVIFLFGFTLAGILGCRETPRTDEKEMPQKEEAQVVKAPEQIISLSQAQTLFDTYSQRRVPLIERFEVPNNDSGAFSAARYTAFDYATIKAYIAFIEQEAADANVEISGLRFYFGNNPEPGDSTSEEDRAKARKNTVFVVPTLNRGGTDFGFYTRDGAGGKREAALIIERPGQNDQSGNGALQETAPRAYAGFAPPPPPMYAGEQSLILNRGNVGPPPNNDF